MSQNEVQNDIDGDEVSVKDLVTMFKAMLRHVRSKWKTVIAFTVIGGIVGLTYAFVKRPVYTAVSTFVLEEGSKASSLSQYAGLATLAGIDISSGGGGIFQGDNILELYKSRLMIEQSLLSPVEINGKKQLLIDRYIDFNRLRQKWADDEKVGAVHFTNDPTRFNRLQDSIVTDIVNHINKKVLTVTKLDKKLSIISVSVATPDEVFSKEFNNRLVETVNNFYTQTKTKKSYQNVVVLQRQADSVKSVLGSSISGVASSIDATPNANPAMLTLRVPSQKRQVDVQTSSAIYSEIVKNLEISKMSLRQDAPLIQVIDNPVFPLQVTKTGKVAGALMGVIIGIVMGVAYVLLKRVVQIIG